MEVAKIKSVFIKTLKYLGITIAILLALMFITPYVFSDKIKEEIKKLAQAMIAEITKAGFGYAFPVIWGNDCKKVWDLRVAGLGLLANIPGDPKGVACIEDTAVDTDDLPEFIREFDQIMLKYGKESIYYAHAGDGEIHLRPILDLKKKPSILLLLKCQFHCKNSN